MLHNSHVSDLVSLFCFCNTGYLVWLWKEKFCRKAGWLLLVAAFCIIDNRKSLLKRQEKLFQDHGSVNIISCVVVKAYHTCWYWSSCSRHFSSSAVCPLISVCSASRSASIAFPVTFTSLSTPEQEWPFSLAPPLATPLL